MKSLENFDVRLIDAPFLIVSMLWLTLMAVMSKAEICRFLMHGT